MSNIKTAFLQGEDIDRKVFVMPPKEAETNVWLLKKCVYSLGDALCKWYKRVKSFLLSIGLKCQKEIHLSFIIIMIMYCRV